MKNFTILFGCFLYISVLPFGPVQEVEASVSSTAILEVPTPVAPAKPTADHRKFELLKKEFKSGPEVTEACLSCHTEAVRQVHKTIHWTWECEKGLGKSKVVTISEFLHRPTGAGAPAAMRDTVGVKPTFATAAMNVMIVGVTATLIWTRKPALTASSVTIPRKLTKNSLPIVDTRLTRKKRSAVKRSNRLTLPWSLGTSEDRPEKTAAHAISTVAGAMGSSTAILIHR